MLYVFPQPISEYRKIYRGQRRVVGSHKPGSRPANSIYKWGWERPKIRSRKIARVVRRDVAKNMQTPCEPDPRRPVVDAPEQAEKKRPNNQTVSQIICVKYIKRQAGERWRTEAFAEQTRLEPSEPGREERTEGEQVRRHAEQNRCDKFFFATGIESRPSPEAVSQSVHLFSL
jgi:hypothetical protein